MLIKHISNLVYDASDCKNKDEIIRHIEKLKANLYKSQKECESINQDKLVLTNLLYQINKDLEDSLSNEKRFVASVSHELRTPLTAILGYGKLLEDTSLDFRQEKYLKSMMESSEYLLSLVSDLLDVAKIEDNRIELSLSNVDLDDIINDCANLIDSKIAQDVEFIVDAPTLKYSVKADEQRVKQIFVNILSNATKFTQKGSIHFYISKVEELEDNRLKIVTNIDDTGIGISSKNIATLFEPFTSTDNTQGTGLGLYISQRLANMMGGEIKVTSKEGEGSSFEVSIVVERSDRKAIGEDLKSVNIMMFSNQNNFIENIKKEFLEYGINFQNYDLSHSDITSTLIQMIANGRFYDIAIFDTDIFKEHTKDIAGTLKAINKDIKLISFNSKKEVPSLFDANINKSITYQRFIKDLSNIYNKKLHKEKHSIDFSKLNILIVDDVLINLEFIKEMMKNYFSISCDTASNGAIAVEKARANRYDVILMDMRMPIMNGLEATREIRKFDTNVPIVCMSANVYKDDKLSAKEAGMNEFIEKPLEYKDIECKLLKLLCDTSDIPANRDIETKEEARKEDITKEEEESNSFEVEDGKVLKDKAINHLKNNFNDAISHKLFDQAIVSLKDYAKRVERDIKRDDFQALSEDFHSLKGILSNIGIKDLANLAEELQRGAEHNNIAHIMDSKVRLVKSLEALFVAP